MDLRASKYGGLPGYYESITFAGGTSTPFLWFWQVNPLIVNANGKSRKSKAEC